MDESCGNSGLNKCGFFFVFLLCVVFKDHTWMQHGHAGFSVDALRANAR